MNVQEDNDGELTDEPKRTQRAHGSLEVMGHHTSLPIGFQRILIITYLCFLQFYISINYTLPRWAPQMEATNQLLPSISVT
jgi:hypothetical protein